MLEIDKVVTIENASFGYGRETILSDISFSINRNDFFAFLGPNGTGKTTLMKAIMREIRPREGSVHVSEDVTIGYVPQLDTEGSFWPMNVVDFVKMFQQKKCCTAEEILKSLNIENIAGKNMQDLSGGQRQRVQLAKALINHPDLLILDEPTDGMDVSAEADYLELLKKLNDEGMTIILVSHHLHDILSVAKKIGIVNNGTIVSANLNDLIENRMLDSIYGRPFLAGDIAGTPVIIPAVRG